MRCLPHIRLLLVWLLVVPLAIAGNPPARADAGDPTTLQLTPLAAGNAAIASVGVSRGRGMERESLGLAVAAGAVIEARVANGVGNVDLSLMTDDHTTDVEHGNGYQPGATRLPADGTWLAITAVADSAVFARTRQWATVPRIEYKVVSGDAFEMPSHRLGDSHSQFVSTWQTSGSPFAVIIDHSFTMLLPRTDLPDVADMAWSDFADLNEVIAFYRNLTSTYDRWLGLSASDPSPLHRNVAQAPFMRPDKTGWGLAYYSGGNYIGTNIGSVRYYLEGPASWLILHEVGHGYDGMMTTASGPGDIQLGEVWNNVYGYQYQTLVNGRTDSNWLNGSSKAADQKRRDDNRRNSGGTVQFNSLGHQDKLDFVARIADLTGTTGFSDFNRRLRELAADTDFSGWAARKDLIAEHWGGAQGHNLSPWFDAHSLPLGAATQETLYDVSQLPIALPLSDLFADAAHARAAAAELDLDSPGALVSSTQAASLASSGIVRVTADTLLPADIEGRLVSAWRGGAEVATAPFRDGVAEFRGLPLGAYTLRFPLSAATGVVPERQWVAARQSSAAATVTVAYPAAATAASLSGSRLTLLGLGNNAFASVDHDPAASTITITDTLAAPHSYFNDQYARISVAATGGTLFDRSFIGDRGRSAPATTTVAAAPGTTITVAHREPSRIVESDGATGSPRPSLDATEPTTTWLVTELGLVKMDRNASWDQEASAREYEQTLEAALSSLAATVAEHPRAQLAPRAAALRTAIDALPTASDRQRLTSQYGAALTAQIALADRQEAVPTPTPSPTPSVTPSSGPTPSVTPSSSPTPSARPSATPTRTATTPAPTNPKPTRPATPAPFDLYSTPGYHSVNGRQWFTQCESYSQTTRCRTEIWGTTVTWANGRFVSRTGWQFNNLTYLASPRSLWAGNKLGHTNAWTTPDGRWWRTECDTPVTGSNGCRSWTKSRVVQARPAAGGGYSYSIEAVEVFNNIVRFS